MKNEREIISPEGVEERVVEEFTFRITMTGGGKFRTYATFDGHDIPGQCFDDKIAAKKSQASMMVMHGGMILDPEKTIDRMMEILTKKNG